MEQFEALCWLEGRRLVRMRESGASLMPMGMVLHAMAIELMALEAMGLESW